ncbi:MAG: kelch repeat-containing protein, partial [Bacteroidota bacterium]
MKKIIASFIFCFLFGECFSQAGEWVWIKGDSIPNQPGNYGVQGVPSPTNNPPALYEPCEWTDLNGNFWLFGGVLSTFALSGDLWKYDIQNNEWTWMKGTSVPNSPGSYGVLGVPSITNNPPSRGYGMTSWVDSTGNLWMFGGDASGTRNDLWKYDTQSNEWTWMKGSQFVNQAGIYGSQGIPATTNAPG